MRKGSGAGLKKEEKRFLKKTAYENVILNEIIFWATF
jgi:hypothetical protein